MFIKESGQQFYTLTQFCLITKALIQNPLKRSLVVLCQSVTVQQPLQAERFIINKSAQQFV